MIPKETRTTMTKAQRLVLCVAVVFASATCTTTNRRNAPAETPRDPAVPAVHHERWRPLHKGGADLSTGVYVREDDDLVVDTPMPIVLRRTYNSGDFRSRQFGLAITHPGEWWIYGNSDPRVPWGDLILADGARIRFTRISPGDTREGAVLRHDTTPTEFNGALLSWTGTLWQMRFQDGSVASFLECHNKPYACSLIERRDADGHRIAYVRDPSGTLLRMESEGQAIAFDYDDHKRIVRAYDSAGHEVSYSYDDRGRLVRVRASNGTVRSYEYDEHDKLAGIREPGRIIRNTFDAEGRWVGQVFKDSDQDDDPYIATVRYIVENGSIVESVLDEGGGVEVKRYNEHHYVVSETLDADGRAPIRFTYDRDPLSNVMKGVTTSCQGLAGPLTRTIPVTSEVDDAMKETLIKQSCVARR